MRPLPPHWPEFIAGLPLLFVFVGAPDCFEHASTEKTRGFFNHVPLADATDAHGYRWPTFGLMVMVILFARYDADTERTLVTELLADEPAELAVRYWPGDTAIEVRP